MRKFSIPIIIALLFISYFFLKKENASDLSSNSKNKFKTISLAWDSYPRSFDPRYAQDAHSQYLEDLIHCSLISYGPDGEIISDLAKKWLWLNSTTLELSLKKNVHFSDGRIVSPDDVKATYDFFVLKIAKKNPSPRAGAFRAIKKISINENKLTFHLNEADASFLNNLSIGILPKEHAQKKMLTARIQAPSCGPFTLKKASLTQLTLERNPHHVETKTGRGSIKIKIIKEPSTRFAKLIRGEIHIAQNNISRDKLVNISTSHPNLKVQKRSGLSTTYLGFNTQDQYLKKVQVRKAISLAINRKSIIKYLLRGFAIPAKTILPPGNLYLNPSLQDPSYNPKEAKRLLDEIGLKQLAPDKPRFQLSYKTTTDSTRIAIAHAIASDLSKIGIQIKVQSLEWGRFKSDVEKGSVQIWGLSWIGFKDPDIYRFAFSSKYFPPYGANRGRFSNHVLDELLDKGQITTKIEERSKIYHQVQSIVGEEYPYAFLFHEEIFAVIHEEIQNFKIYADGRYSSLKKAVRL